MQFSRGRSSASSFNFQYPLFSLGTSSSCLCLLPRLPVTLSFPTFPSITRFRRRFLRNMRPIQLVFLICTFCRLIHSSSTLCNFFSFLTRSAHLTLLIVLQHHTSKLSRYCWSTFRSVEDSAPYRAMPQIWYFTCFFLKFKFNFLVKSASFFFLNAAFPWQLWI
jgi:hypothetical protein